MCSFQIPPQQISWYIYFCHFISFIVNTIPILLTKQSVIDYTRLCCSQQLRGQLYQSVKLVQHYYWSMHMHTHLILCICMCMHTCSLTHAHSHIHTYYKTLQLLYSTRLSAITLKIPCYMLTETQL